MGRGETLAGQLAAARLHLEANARRLAEIRAQLLATQELVRADRSERQKLHESAYARLRARLDSLPVIEQAKGILMAQTGCSPEEAFDLLRRASQRANIRVRDLAAKIIGQAATAAGRGQPVAPRPGHPAAGGGATRGARRRSGALRA
jgi:hypothetical protein